MQGLPFRIGVQQAGFRALGVHQPPLARALRGVQRDCVAGVGPLDV
eukprot:CAMPEP_0202868880 /NCGR_PEP_ID=MMETSP1391-20130828/11284_1 /ASSEMBLY_ACC=CAM_ASM_000867 /TAXON_ID=1034604 /ORGANISM="Chlamydomonas leiostraca, Strain SAG 11-49" /LENGTH=45 /DNA_ID= /DNA_START= /DNA_END= /DNA_ORIENTATION=